MDGASGIKFDAGTAMACLWAGIAFWFITHCAVSGARRWMGARNTPLHGRAQGNSLVPCAQVAIPAEVKVDDAGDSITALHSTPATAHLSHSKSTRRVVGPLVFKRSLIMVGQRLRERRFAML